MVCTNLLVWGIVRKYGPKTAGIYKPCRGTKPSYTLSISWGRLSPPVLSPLGERTLLVSVHKLVTHYGNYKAEKS